MKSERYTLKEIHHNNYGDKPSLIYRTKDGKEISRLMENEWYPVEIILIENPYKEKLNE
jgi:hypothetical protein